MCAKEREKKRRRQREGRKRRGEGERQSSNLGFQYPGGALPEGQWDQGVLTSRSLVKLGDFISVGMESNVLIPRSKDARVNLHRVRSCEPAFKNRDFALASKIEATAFLSPANKLDLPVEAKLEPKGHREDTFKSL